MPRKANDKVTEMDVLVAVRAKAAMQRGRDERERRFQVALAKIHRVLRHTPQRTAVEIMCRYMALDELEGVALDLEAKKRRANGVATKDSDS